MRLQEALQTALPVAQGAGPEGSSGTSAAAGNGAPGLTLLWREDTELLTFGEKFHIPFRSLPLFLTLVASAQTSLVSPERFSSSSKFPAQHRELLGADEE